QCFDAAALAAAAALPVVVDADVPAFGGASGAPVINALVENNARADAGAERGVEHVAKSDARAPEGFGEGRGVRVIIDFGAHVKDAPHFRGQRKIPPARHVWRIQHHAGARIERSWRANSNSGEPG